MRGLVRRFQGSEGTKSGGVYMTLAEKNKKMEGEFLVKK
jgi:hypothetical protein